ncbi:MAG: hypothetical protein PHT94_02080 [Candidatus Nanoarchaeia archaeon]|nr:hypothetical protein [Candidatus Nanoarchaeia archaeon]
MFYIKDLENKVENEFLHKIFRRYSRGIFEKETIEIKKTAKKITIKGGPNLLNDLLEFIIKNDDSPEFEIKGKILAKKAKSTMENLEIKIKKSTAKGDKIDLDYVISNEKLQKLYDELKNDNILLSLKSKKTELKSKTSLGQPGSIIEGFCRLNISDEKIMKEFDKEFSSFFANTYKTISTKQIFEITDIIADESLDPVEMARLAKRKGIIKLDLIIDGKESKKEVHFLV